MKETQNVTKMWKIWSKLYKFNGDLLTKEYNLIVIHETFSKENLPCKFLGFLKLIEAKNWQSSTQTKCNSLIELYLREGNPKRAAQCLTLLIWFRQSPSSLLLSYPSFHPHHQRHRLRSQPRSRHDAFSGSRPRTWTSWIVASEAPPSQAQGGSDGTPSDEARSVQKRWCPPSLVPRGCHWRRLVLSHKGHGLPGIRATEYQMPSTQRCDGTPRLWDCGFPLWILVVEICRYNLVDPRLWSHGVQKKELTKTGNSWNRPGGGGWWGEWGGGRGEGERRGGGVGGGGGEGIGGCIRMLKHWGQKMKKILEGRKNSDLGYFRAAKRTN